MSCDFKPGDEVVCVVDTFEPHSDNPASRQFVVGVVATVSEVYLDEEGVWLVLSEATDSDLYDDGCFRKVQKRDLQAWLKTAAPAPHLDRRPRVPA